MKQILIAGLPGKMASLIVGSLISAPDQVADDFNLIDVSLTGDNMPDEVVISGSKFFLLRPAEHRSFFQELWKENAQPVAIDFTHPSAANDNADFYCRFGIPFVMGTTGGDQKSILAQVKSSNICAVVAPNMAAPVVAFQAMMEYAADNFAGLFAGYSMQVRESHQTGKADTSGTAKTIVKLFNQMGVDFAVEQIGMERNPKSQELVWGIPQEHLGGHGWHTYTLTSPDKSVNLEFTHNINGRQVYADGTIVALNYLMRKIKEGCRGQVFSMIDVLKGK